MAPAAPPPSTAASSSPLGVIDHRDRLIGRPCCAAQPGPQGWQWQDLHDSEGDLPGEGIEGRKAMGPGRQGGSAGTRLCSRGWGRPGWCAPSADRCVALAPADP